MIGARDRAERSPRRPLRTRYVTQSVRSARIAPRAHARLHDGQPHHGGEIVVGGDAVVPFEAAAEASMHDGVLALGARKRADGRHGPAAVARSIAGRLAVDVARVEALRAVVAVLASIQGPAYERPAMPAAKLLARSPKAARAPLISIGPRHGVLRLSRRPAGRQGDRGHVAIRLTMSRVRAVGCGMLQLLCACSMKRKSGHGIRSCGRMPPTDPRDNRRRIARDVEARRANNQATGAAASVAGVRARRDGVSERIRQETQRLRPTWRQ